MSGEDPVKPGAFAAYAQAPMADGKAQRAGGGPSGDDYLRVIQSRPEALWEPGTLTEAMHDAGFPTVNFESARTQLYRMENRGQIIKAQRGRWRMALPVDHISAAIKGLATTAQPGQVA